MLSRIALWDCSLGLLSQVALVLLLLPVWGLALESFLIWFGEHMFSHAQTTIFNMPRRAIGAVLHESVRFCTIFCVDYDSAVKT